MSERLTDRPTKPGVWFRDWNDLEERGASDLNQAWVVYSLPGNPALRAAWITPGGELRCHSYVSALTGNWSPAVPAARVAELEGLLVTLGQTLIDAGPADDRGPPPDVEQAYHAATDLVKAEARRLAQGTTP